MNASKAAHLVDSEVGDLVGRDAFERASKFGIVITRSAGGKFIGTVREFPNVLVQESDAARCHEAMTTVLALAIADMLKGGRPVPSPGDVRRNVQVNVRLTDEEKRQIEAAGHIRGFSGVSDFMRTAAVQFARGATVNDVGCSVTKVRATKVRGVRVQRGSARTKIRSN